MPFAITNKTSKNPRKLYKQYAKLHWIQKCEVDEHLLA